MSESEPRVRDLFGETARCLAAVLGSDDEGVSAARIIFEDVAGWSRLKIFTDGDRTLTAGSVERINNVVQRVVSGEPVQYAVGHARFMGNDYVVNRSVLIPRPETSALVDAVADSCKGRSDVRVLDIGTGSGCIAISLAKALPFSQVTAVDISADALAVARQNAERLGAAVQFILMDILAAEPLATPLYDVVVSNPPYIMQSEESDMSKRVKDYEPSQALFVPDDDPLLFYKAIGRYAAKALVPGGRLFFEINSLMARQTVELLRTAGYIDVEAVRDYRGLYRYVFATKPL